MKKNYYVYSEGLPFYDNMREEELQQKADTISTLVAPPNVPALLY
jgi:hypothetical protein